MPYQPPIRVVNRLGTWELRFTIAGEYPYVCYREPVLRGTQELYARGGNPPLTTRQQGQVVCSLEPDGEPVYAYYPNELGVYWHLYPKNTLCSTLPL